MDKINTNEFTKENAIIILKNIEHFIKTSIVKRPELMGFLLLGDIYFTNKYSNATTTILGRLLLFANAFNGISFVKDGLNNPLTIWNKYGLQFSGNNDVDKMISYLSIFGIGISSVSSLLTSIFSGKNPSSLNVLSFATHKLGFVSCLLYLTKNDTKLQNHEELLNLIKYHLRTGIILFFYGLSLLWKNRNKNTYTPKYVQELEKRLNLKLDNIQKNIPLDNKNKTTNGLSSSTTTTTSGSALSGMNKTTIINKKKKY